MRDWKRSLPRRIEVGIALACGHIGPSAEYLLNTVARCKELGVHDPYLWRMQALVAKRMNAVWQL